MSPPWRLWSLILVGLLAVAACTSRAESDGETTSPSTTSASITTVQSTTTSTVAVEEPDYLLFGPEGITRVEGGGSVRLIDQPVVKAVDDFMGGVVFAYDQEDQPWVDRPVYWLAAGSTEPVVVAEASWSSFSVALVDGRPSLVHTDEDVRYGAVETGDLDTWHLLLTDLLSGHRRVLFHHSQWFEGGIDGVTGGGERFVGEQWDVMSTWRIVAFDLDGEEIDLPAGVHADPPHLGAGWGCWRVCELDAFMSPDGEHLVTWFWPEAEAPRDDQMAWWEQAKTTPATVRITDLDTGEISFETEVPAETMLGDFDGRFLALREVTRIPQESVTTDSTLIVDTGGELGDLRVPGKAALVRIPIAPPDQVSAMDAHWTVILASLSVGEDPLETSEAYETARSREEQFRAEFDLEIGVLMSDDYITLNPGYWVVFTGAFATRDEAAARCEELEPLVGSCYPRYVATPRSIDPAVDQRVVGQWDEVSVSLQPGEYGSVDFTEPDDPLNGLQREDGTRIGVMDEPSSFLLPEHGEADFLWFSRGTITWRFPNPLPANAQPRFLRFNVEVSSEAAQARAPHPSEMTVTVNGVEIGRWVIPADPDAGYGNPDDPQVARQRNHLEPWRSQFGWLTHWTVDNSGTWYGYDSRLGDAAAQRVSGVALDTLGLAQSEVIEVAVTVREATVKGVTGFGLNVYGSTWGDYPIDPTVTVAYSALPVGPMQDLGNLSSSVAHFSNADAINDRGQIVGDSYANTEWHMFLWDQGQMADLGTPPWGTPDFVWPSAINERGQIVGTFRTSEIRDTAGFLFENGEWTVILADGAMWSNAVDINNSGQVLGNENLTGGDIEVFIWEKGSTTYLDLNLPDTAHYLVPERLTDRGQILGYYHDDSSGPGEPPMMRSFLWDRGVMSDISASEGEMTQAFDMNAQGQVVGQYYTDTGGNTQAFLWQNGVMANLPGLSDGPSGATAINNHGQIVGAAQTPSGDMHAILWENGKPTDLGTLGGVESFAYGINERGQVIGWARTEYDSIHAFLWER